MICGECGSGITADEKFKTLLDGTRSRHVYYVCTRAKNQHCRGVSLNEKEIIKQLSEMIDRVRLDQLGIKQKLEAEMDRFNQFRYSVLELTDKEIEKQKKVDMKKYAKFILEKGALLEKRDLLRSLNSKLQIQDKKIIFISQG